MFDRLFRRAERKIDSVVAKYVRRVLVAVPLLIAAVFATLAITVKLLELYGPLYGYGMMAGGFVVLSGVVALSTISMSRESPAEEAAKEEAAEKADDEKGPAVPPELLSVVTAAAPVALPGIARAAARNLPILILLAIIGYLFARYVGGSSGTSDAADGAADDATPDVGDEVAAAASSTRQAADAAVAAAA